MSYNLPEGVSESILSGLSHKEEPKYCVFHDDDAPAEVDMEYISATIIRETWYCSLCGLMHAEDRDTTEDGI